MSKLEKWLFSKIIRRNLYHGVNHAYYIATFYSWIREAVREEYPGDNEPTLNVLLRQIFETTQYPEVSQPSPPPEPVATLPLQPSINIETARVQALEL
jgi:hypothetical protein